jgi:acetylglutamate kinase
MSSSMKVRLIYCFEKKGVLSDVSKEDSVIRHLPKKLYDDLLTKNVFADGILPKLENAYAAIQAGVNEVLIGEAGDLIKNIQNETEGTLITP